MEIAVIWFLSMMAMGNEINTTIEKNMELEARVISQDVRMDTLETTLLQTVGAHAGLYARHKHDIDKIQTRLDNIEAPNN